MSSCPVHTADELSRGARGARVITPMVAWRWRSPPLAECCWAAITMTAAAKTQRIAMEARRPTERHHNRVGASAARKRLHEAVLVGEFVSGVRPERARRRLVPLHDEVQAACTASCESILSFGDERARDAAPAV